MATPATPVVLLPGAAVLSANGVGATVDLTPPPTAPATSAPDIDTLRLTLTVRAVAGTAVAPATTPTLDLSLETSDDGVSFFFVKKFPQVGTTGATLAVFQPVRRYVRLRWALTGTTPSFIVDVLGVKLKSYLTLAQFKTLMRGQQFGNIADELLEAHIAAASDEASSRVSNAFTMPLITWGDDLRRKVASMAMWGYLSEGRGFNPENGSDKAIRMNYDDALRWLQGVNTNNIALQGVVDSTPDVDEEDAVIYSEPARGW